MVENVEFVTIISAVIIFMTGFVEYAKKKWEEKDNNWRIFVSPKTISNSTS